MPHALLLPCVLTALVAVCAANSGPAQDPARAGGKAQDPERVRRTEPRDALEVVRRLRGLRLDDVEFTAETGDYLEVVRLLRTVSGVPILVTPDARRIIADEGLVLELDIVAPLALANVLDLMVSKSDELGWRVRRGVVEITTRAKAGGEPVMRLHDVREQTFPRTEFLPPEIGSIPTGERFGGPPRSGGEGEEKVSRIEPDQLVDVLKLATDSRYWDVEGGGTIDWVESGYLLVHASPAMQRRVARVLRGLR